MGFWGSDVTVEEEAERARRVAAAEEKARQWEAEFQRRLRVASDAGYRYPPGNDPVMQFNCPTCGAAVMLSGVERHIEWHASL